MGRKGVKGCRGRGAGVALGAPGPLPFSGKAGQLRRVPLASWAGHCNIRLSQALSWDGGLSHGNQGRGSPLGVLRGAGRMVGRAAPQGPGGASFCKELPGRVPGPACRHTWSSQVPQGSGGHPGCP